MSFKTVLYIAPHNEGMPDLLGPGVCRVEGEGDIYCAHDAGDGSYPGWLQLDRRVAYTLTSGGQYAAALGCLCPLKAGPMLHIQDCAAALLGLHVGGCKAL